MSPPVSRAFTWNRRAILGRALLCLALSDAQGQMPEGFGASVNPTGQPIGGGAGYTAGPKRGEATRHVRTLDELKQALAAAKAGEVIWIESGSTIDFTGTRIEVPEKVTLAGDRGQNGSDGA